MVVNGCTELITNECTYKSLSRDHSDLGKRLLYYLSSQTSYVPIYL